jgi:gliding motility-associated-like protein
VYRWQASPSAGSGLPNISNNSAITVTPSSAGDYQFKYHVEVAGCSTDTVSLRVRVNAKPAISLSSNGPLNCVGDNDNLELRESGGIAVRWAWTGPAGFNSTLQNPVIPRVGPQNSGTYQLAIIDRNGCTISGTLDITVTQGIPKPRLDASKLLYCGGEDSLVLTATQIPGATYSWSGPATISSSGHQVVIAGVTEQYAGSYSVFAVNQAGCKSPVSDPVEVEVLGAPVCQPDVFSVIFETPITINVVTNDDFDPLEPFMIEVISPPQKGTLENLKDGQFTYRPNPKALDDDYFTYEVCYNACKMLCDKAVVTLRIAHDPQNCVIPTVITPNDDGKNDLFKISCIEAGTFPDNEILIFNEWGDMVFEAAPYGNDWGGTCKGKPLPDGTYYYIFKRNPDAKPEKGFLTIYR